MQSPYKGPSLPRGLGRPHSPTETVSFTFAASPVCVKQSPPALVHQHLHPFPMCHGAGSQPSKQCSSKLPLCLFSCKTLPMGKKWTDVKVSPWLTVNSFNFSSLAHSCSVTVSLAFPQLLVSLTATTCHIFELWNFEDRPVFLSAICRSSMHIDTTMTWIQVSSQVSNTGLVGNRAHMRYVRNSSSCRDFCDDE